MEKSRETFWAYVEMVVKNVATMHRGGPRRPPMGSCPRGLHASRVCSCGSRPPATHPPDAGLPCYGQETLISNGLFTGCIGLAMSIPVAVPVTL